MSIPSDQQPPPLPCPGTLSKCRRGGERSPNPHVSLETVQHWHVLGRETSVLWHRGSEEAGQHFLCMDLLLGGGKRSLGEVPFVAEVSPLLSGPAQAFSLCLTQSWAYYCFICYPTTINFQKVFVFPCSYLSVGSEVSRSSRVPQMVGKFF